MHFLEDMVPHWDVGEGLGDGRRTIRQAFWLELVDLALVAGMLYFFWLKNLGASGESWHVIAGALAGLLPDFLAAPKIFLGLDWKFMQPLERLHAWADHSISNRLLGLLPQILLLIGVYLLK